ncbi:MAG TPA: response regulator, partial [Burkholderiaceae bacterium]|nr:response regulator [Burkholderiaceae bacterium]
MAEQRRALLIVERDLALQRQLKWSFEHCNAIVAQDHDSAIAQLRRHEPDVVMLDLDLPPQPGSTANGFRTLSAILAMAPATKVIALTAPGDRGETLRAIDHGAYDFCEKPFDVETLNLVVGRAFRMAELDRDLQHLKRQQTTEAFGGLVTRDPGMLKVCRQIDRLAPTTATVLL